MKSKYRDVISAAFVIAMAIFIAYFSKDIRTSSFTNPGPSFFPKVIASMLGALGVILLIMSIMKVKRGGFKSESSKVGMKDSTSSNSQKGNIISRNSDWVSVILIIAYAFLLGELGYIISTIVYLLLQMILLSIKGKRNFLSFGLVSLIAPIIIYLIFIRVFGLILPQGILG